MIRTSELRRRAEHRLDRQSQAPALQSVAAEQLQQVPPLLEYGGMRSDHTLILSILSEI